MRRVHHREVVAELRSRIAHLEHLLNERTEECHALQELVARAAGTPFAPESTVRGPREPATVNELVPAGLEGFGFDNDYVGG